MGLDMYLYALPKKSKIESLKDFDDLYDKADARGDDEYFEVWAQWRKANAIHGWFINHCKCIEENTLYEVTQEDILQLVGTCVNVLLNKEKAEKCLPVCQGCFFGDYEYDAWYEHDLMQTIEFLGHALSMNWGCKKVKGEETSTELRKFYYYASW